MRFQEFTDKWHITTLGECSTSLDYGLGASAIEYDGIHKYIRITDISETTNQFISKNLTSPSYFNDNYKVKQNDILFARTGASVGKTYYYNSNDGNLYYAGFLIAAHIIKEVDSKFVFYNTLSKNYNKWVKIMSARSGQPGINAEEYGSYNFYIPKLDEQNKISFLMEKIDRRIQTQSKIIDKYITLIYCLNNHLAHDAVDSKDTLNNIFDIYTGKKANQSENGKYLIIDMGTISSNGKYVNPKYTNITNNILSKGELVMPKDDIGGGNIICKTFYVEKDNKYVLSDHVYALRLKNKNFESYYFSCLINSPTINRELKRLVTGSAQLGINIESLSKFKLDYCGIVELQCMYTNILRDINEKYEIEKKYLELLKLQKIYLLSNLFI